MRPRRSCIPVSDINKESEVQYGAFVLLVIPLMESSFALLRVQVKQEANALNMKNTDLRTAQKQNSTDQKVVKALSHWDGWTLICQ